AAEDPLYQCYELAADRKSGGQTRPECVAVAGVAIGEGVPIERKGLLPPRALPDTHFRWDHDRFGRRHLVPLVDPLKVEPGGFPAQLDAVLVYCRKGRRYQLGKCF